MRQPPVVPSSGPGQPGSQRQTTVILFTTYTLAKLSFSVRLLIIYNSFPTLAYDRFNRSARNRRRVSDNVSGPIKRRYNEQNHPSLPSFFGALDWYARFLLESNFTMPVVNVCWTMFNFYTTLKRVCHTSFQVIFLNGKRHAVPLCHR